VGLEMSRPMKRPLLLSAVVALVGCDGRKREILAYADEACACTTYDCTLDVQAKYEGTLVKPESWFERHFTSSAAEAAMVERAKRAYACQHRLEPPKIKCGGPQKLECPANLRCVHDPTLPDAEGVCGPYPQDVLPLHDD